MKRSTLPLYHLYGDPPDDQAFDFIHIERLTHRSLGANWVIAPHRHRNLFQIMFIEQGGGTLDLEAESIAFDAPAVMLLAPTVAHGFRFRPKVTEGFVINFTEDVTESLGEQANVALARLKHIAGQPLMKVSRGEISRLSTLCRDLLEEEFLGREGFEVAMRATLALIGVEVARLGASRELSGTITLAPADATVEELRRLIEQNFRSERQIGFYANKLAMTADRLNDHVKRATGVTAGHLLRQRLLTEAKRQLVFTDLTIGEVAYDLAFADPSHFARFFKKQTGSTPQAFREASLRSRGGATH